MDFLIDLGIARITVVIKVPTPDNQGPAVIKLALNKYKKFTCILASFFENF